MTYGSFCFGIFFFVWFLIPETKGLSLEHMDKLFGIPDGDRHIELHDLDERPEKISPSKS